jgi:NAD(P)-dependent dehydrogenase (short-subunit alcohol dehydrogenase family)
VITGGAGNIGLVTAQRFLLEGAKVALIDLSESRLQAAKTSLTVGCDSSIERADERILVLEADVTVEEQMKHALEQTVAAFGSLDVCFLNAGISYSATPLLDTSVDLFDRCMKVNTTSGEMLFLRPQGDHTRADKRY